MKMRLTFATALAASLLSLSNNRAIADQIVSPNSRASVEGNSNNGSPFNAWWGGGDLVQQVHAATDFGSLPTGGAYITQIAFRPDVSSGTAFSSTFSNVRIELSTTSKSPDGLDPNIAANRGADHMIVYGGPSGAPLTLSSSFTGPADGPKDFDIVINLTTPFLYDPSKGNLLVDLVSSGGGTSTQFDAEMTPGDSVSRNGDTLGLVIRFTTVPRGLQITAHPQSQVGYWGKSVTFSVGASYGVPPYTYQWFKGVEPISEATTAQLNLSNLQDTDEGDYSVVVTDADNNTLSSQAATLTVNPAGVSIATYAGLTIDGVIGQTYGIQTTTDLGGSGSWAGVANVTLTQPSQIWYDSQSTAQQPRRFYRVVAGPISIPY